MNVEAFMTLADVIEQNEDRFSLNYYGAITVANGVYVEYTYPDLMEKNACGAVACICGWQNVITGDGLDNEETAREGLGITYDQGNRLFFAGNDSVWYGVAAYYGWTTDAGGVKDCGEITGLLAADVLRRIARGEFEL